MSPFVNVKLRIESLQMDVTGARDSWQYFLVKYWLMFCGIQYTRGGWGVVLRCFWLMAKVGGEEEHCQLRSVNEGGGGVGLNVEVTLLCIVDCRLA